MSRNFDAGLVIRDSVIVGPAAIGGDQHLITPPRTPSTSQRSVSSQIWAGATAVWTMCPIMVWAMFCMSEGPLPGLADLAHAATPYAVLAWFVAVWMDVAFFFLHRHWPVAQRAITHPVTWNVRLFGAVFGLAGLAASIYASTR